MWKGFFSIFDECLEVHFWLLTGVKLDIHSKEDQWGISYIQPLAKKHKILIQVKTLVYL